jgi:predicted ATP-binding protein involved in virulence
MEPSNTYQTFGHWFQYAALSAMEFDCYLKERNSDQKNPYREVLRAVSRAIGISISSMGWKDIDYSVSLQSLVVTHEHIGTLPVSALSDGIRSVISMVADIAYRMVRLNPDLGEETATKTPGIVLIDEVDMHLHPSWQQTVVADLQKAFPLVQFIITTHSPQVLTTVPARAIRALRWDDGQVEIYSPEFSLGAESYQLLKEIQNVDTRPQALPIVKTLMRYLELVSDDQWDSDEAIALRKELDEWGKNREPALIKADMNIKMRAYRRHKK